jgi:hypothetical protein
MPPIDPKRMNAGAAYRETAQRAAPVVLARDALPALDGGRA